MGSKYQESKNRIILLSLAWMDSTFCVEYNGEGFKRKCWPQAELWWFISAWVDLWKITKTCKMYHEVHILSLFWEANYGS